MNKQHLAGLIRKKMSFLCVGLDSDITKIPKHLLTEEDPVFAFNKAIIDATIDLAVAYKPNLAFYESRGLSGWHSLEKTINYLNGFGDDVFTIADAKRGDIGNTSQQYAKAFFETLPFDAITVAPYMGKDSVTPFLTYPGKWVVLLVLTSNEGALDFQMTQPWIPSTLDKLGIRVQYSHKKLYEQVIAKSFEWADDQSMMFVVGATKAEMLQGIRKLAPDHFLLVPGVGAQGGSLEAVAEFGMNKDCGLLVNASRSIIFGSKGEDFAEKARTEALLLQREMEQLLIKHQVIS
jgi:orotidine-5'-phosphate decarboxylase